MKPWAGIGLFACAFQAFGDSSPPQVLDAFVPLHALGQIAVVFSEPMSDDALDLFNYFVHETESPQTQLFLSGARFDDAPRNTTVLLTPMGNLSGTAAYTFNIPAGYIADLEGEYVGDVTRPLYRERVLLSTDRDQEWKYHAKGIDLGSAWKEPGYDDSSWSNGVVLFYAASAGPPMSPVPPGTALPTSDNLNQPINTFYFRAKVFAPYTGVTSLRLRSFFDDGGVVYLNGAETYRFSMPDAPAPITYATPASRTVTNYNWFPPTNRFGATVSAPLPPGEHVIAVEVHQYTNRVSPIAMALYLTAVAEGVCSCPLQLLRQPEAVYVFEAAPFSLSVEVRGPNPRYQWFKDDALIPGATNRTYSVARATYCGDTGRYRATVTNEFSTVHTVPVWVYIGEGPEPPWLYSAVGEPGRTTIRLQWDRPLPSAWLTNAENYRLDELTISNVSLLSNNRVRLHTSPRQPARLYELTVLNTARATCLSNLIYPDIHKTIDLEESVLWYDAVWAYHDLGEDLGTAWHAPEYDDSAWPRGQALLGVESWSTLSNLEPRLITLNTPLQLITHPVQPTNYVARTIYYFRTQFENILPSVTRFNLTHVIDDGAVFYLDGVELARFNMPPGPIDYSTLATNGGETAYRTNGLYTVAPGPHVLAVAVHQSSMTSSDVVFGAAFEILLPLPSVRVYRLFGGDLAIETRYDAVIETAPSPTGPWTFWANGGTRFVRPDGPSRFYRARRD